jgi:hypothetical protein
VKFPVRPAKWENRAGNNYRDSNLKSGVTIVTEERQSHHGVDSLPGGCEKRGQLALTVRAAQEVAARKSARISREGARLRGGLSESVDGVARN